MPHVLHCLSEHCMVIVQPRCCYGCNKKLAAVGVLPSVRHADEQWPAVFHLERFVVEIFAINTEGPGAIAIFDIATCNDTRNC